MPSGNQGPLAPEAIGSTLPSVPPGSQPAQGVSGTGAPPVAEGQPASKLADGTPTDKAVPYSRFAEVNEALSRTKEELAAFQALREDPDFLSWAAQKYGAPAAPTHPTVPQPRQEPVPPPAGARGAQDPGEAWLRGLIREAVGEVVAPVTQSLAAQQRKEAAKMQLAELQAKIPDFNPQDDLPLCLRVMQEKRAGNLLDAFTLAFPARAAGVRTPMPQSPGQDVRARAPASPEDSPEYFMDALKNPNLKPYEREQIAQQLIKRLNAK